MRRKTGIVIGACTALALAGSAATVVLTRTSDRPVGIWHEAPAVARTPVAARAESSAATGTAVPGAPRTPGASRTEQATVTPSAAASPAVTPGTVVPPDTPGTPGATKGSGVPVPGSAERPVESAAVTSRERVGELLPVSRVLEYLTGPKREKFHYPGASYVKLHFDRMAMLPGDYLTVSNPSRTESYRYDAPEKLNTGEADRWAMSITGDTAIVEMHRAVNPLGLGDLLGSLGVRVDQVARGFDRKELRRESRRAGSGREQSARPGREPARPGRGQAAGPGREESVCGADTSGDAVCYQSADPIAFTKSKAIARLLINGTELCTGWRIGAKNRMITNNHCLTSNGEAYDTEVWFNYQCAKCGGYDVFKPTKVWGDKVVATDRTLDYTLFSVDSFPSVEKFGYLMLDTARPARGQELYVPQHPAGEPTRIAGAKGDKASNCTVENPDYTGYAAHSDVSYFCDTAGGSSGSPVLSRRTNKVVALHHFGGCPNSGVRGDLLAARLRPYL
ncbi:serine protease [Actinoplanes sp. DH11]|uniref:S1 family peptidase n=1 Tax=Actinoplanes sp. DH11 TaxID=2857011 RepID=UPI001E2E824F|nr:serine protease [Actinoplanes sp. DH11]